MMNDLLEHGLSPSGGSYREISPGANQGVQTFSTTLYVPGLERKERSAAYRQSILQISDVSGRLGRMLRAPVIGSAETLAETACTDLPLSQLAPDRPVQKNH